MTTQGFLKSVLVAALLISVSPVEAAAPKKVAAQVSLEAPSGTYGMDLTHASIVWRVNHLGLSHYPARFAKFDATLQFDAANPEKSSIAVTIDPKSIRTEFPYPDKEDFDAKLSNSDKFFNADKFPTITFTSTKVQRLAGNKGKITGNLTLLGVTKPVVLDVSLNGAMKEHPFSKKPALGFAAKTTIKRSDFGMTYLVPIVSDDVTIEIEAEFQKKD